MNVSRSRAHAVSIPEPLGVNPAKLIIKWNADPENTDYNKIFFEYLFPSLEGKALVPDQILANWRCGIYQLV